MGKTKNSDCTRFYSNQQEQAVAKLLHGQQTANSGATAFVKGDVVCKASNCLVECKTCLKEKDSFSIKREWLEKNAQEAKITHYSNSMLAFNFGPNTKNYFVIDEKLAQYLVEKIEEDLKDIL